MRTAVMEGSLSEFDLSSLIQVVSIGRQFTGIELSDETGSVVGTLYLKSGKILDAKSGSLSGIDAVTTLLRDSRRRRFSVYRTDPFDDVKSPVGSVGEVLVKLMQSEAVAVERVAVMDGSLAEFDLMTVLQVISIGRQFTGVDVTDSTGTLVGRIELKAGKVVSAKSAHLDGIDAIRRLVRSPRDSRFVVYRSHAEVGEQHLGSLAQIVMKMSDVDTGWDQVESSTQAQRPARPAAAPPADRMPPLARPVSSGAGSASASSSEALPKVHARQPPGELGHSSPFVDIRTSPFGLTTLPLQAGNVAVVCVTSPKGGAGKTTVALNLSVALARQGKRVILIDADFDGVLLSLNAKPKSKSGAYDIVAGKGGLADAAVKTRVSGLRIIASGEPSSAAFSTPDGWARLFEYAKAEADIVLVDTGAGLHGPSADACSAATHALVVLPAEPASIRALPPHLERLAALAIDAPKVVGIVLNMLDYRARVSLDVLRDVCAGPSAPWVFDIPIARSPAFMEAVARGVPLCREDRSGTPTIGWVFEMLASGILERLGVVSPSLDESPFV